MDYVGEGKDLPHTEGIIQEVGAKHVFDHYTYSMYDRESAGIYSSNIDPRYLQAAC